MTERQKVIVCAACRYGSTVLCGARHWDKVMHRQLEALKLEFKPPHGSEWEQGFIDQFGDFHDRITAMQLVKNSGQPFNVGRNGRGDTALFSEGLY